MGRTKGEGKAKRKKDVNKPKRATSAYFYFLAHKREESKRAGRAISKIAEFTKECSELWRNLGSAEKKTFETKAATDKSRYDREMALYKGKSEADKDKPKRPATAYFVFLADFRIKMKGQPLDHKEIIKKAGEAWRGMSDEDKKPYERKSQELAKKYENDVKEWREKKGAACSPPKMQQQYVQQSANNGMEDDDDEEDDDEEDESEEDDE